ncbi:MAG: hypothetical protein H7A25_22420 [Leptospiraceae bacterium]|nr:hypothetical protein [Leptospiraceae bacterium]MCP5502670.1 hypothetical protein [Leptospiraceae bacterium]
MKALEIASKIQEYKIILLQDFTRLVEQHGLRPSAKILGISHSGIYKVINGHPVKIETLAEYILRFSEYEKENK